MGARNIMARSWHIFTVMIKNIIGTSVAVRCLERCCFWMFFDFILSVFSLIFMIYLRPQLNAMQNKLIDA